MRKEKIRIFALLFPKMRIFFFSFLPSVFLCFVKNTNIFEKKEDEIPDIFRGAFPIHDCWLHIDRPFLYFAFSSLE